MNYNPKNSVDWVFGILVLLSYHGMCSEITRSSLQKVATQGNNEAKMAKISLAFVFDRTGSMYDDLVQVRAGAARILNTTIASGENAVQDYILVPFRDPGKN